MGIEQTDEIHMQRALALAEKAEALGEVPVGAVLVANDEVIAAGWNQPIASHDPTAHAEICALRAAGQIVGNYRFPGSTLYVTLEPCGMCAVALIHARVCRIVYGASDPKTGAFGGAYDILAMNHHNHLPAVESGVLAAQSAALLQAFFARRRG